MIFSLLWKFGSFLLLLFARDQNTRTHIRRQWWWWRREQKKRAAKLSWLKCFKPRAVLDVFLCACINLCSLLVASRRVFFSLRFGFGLLLFLSFGFLPVVTALSAAAAAAAWFLFKTSRNGLECYCCVEPFDVKWWWTEKNANAEVLTDACMRIMLAYEMSINVLVLMPRHRGLRTFACVVKSKSHSENTVSDYCRCIRAPIANDIESIYAAAAHHTTEAKCI